MTGRFLPNELSLVARRFRDSDAFCSPFVYPETVCNSIRYSVHTLKLLRRLLMQMTLVRDSRRTRTLNQNVTANKLQQQ